MFATLAGGYPRPAPPEDPGAPDPALAVILAEQAAAGLEILSDGLVHDAGSNAETLAGVLVARWAAAAAAAERPVKLAVLGPISAAAAGQGPAGAVAEALNGALGALAAAGCRLIEVHEPAATTIRDEAGRAAFTDAHRRLAADLGDCVHLSLAITGGNADALGAAALIAAPYASYLLDLVDGPESWRLVVEVPGDRGIVCGALDATGRGRTRLEELVFAARYAASTGGRGLDRVGIAPSGSLAGRPREEALAAIGLLGEAAALLRGDHEDLLRRLDPRAVDARSAAIGEYRPRRPRSARPGG